MTLSDHKNGHRASQLALVGQLLRTIPTDKTNKMLLGIALSNNEHEKR